MVSTKAIKIKAKKIFTSSRFMGRLLDISSSSTNKRLNAHSISKLRAAPYRLHHIQKFVANEINWKQCKLGRFVCLKNSDVNYWRKYAGHVTVPDFVTTIPGWVPAKKVPTPEKLWRNPCSCSRARGESCSLAWNEKNRKIMTWRSNHQCCVIGWSSAKHKSMSPL